MEEEGRGGEEDMIRRGEMDEGKGRVAGEVVERATVVKVGKRRERRLI